jgi:hypothetical protein
MDKSLKVSTHFTLGEATVTNTGLDNTPDATQLANIKYVATVYLDNLVVRLAKFLGHAVDFDISSWFRSKTVNLKVGGSATSSHCKGLAVDITEKHISVIALFKFIIENFEYDQVIYEKHGDDEWVHWGFEKKSKSKRFRKQIMTSLAKGKYIAISKQEALEMVG